MRILHVIAVVCLAGLKLSIAREDQTEERRDELSLLLRRVDNLEEALKEKDNEILELQEKIEADDSAPFGYYCAYAGGWSFWDTEYTKITLDTVTYSSESAGMAQPSGFETDGRGGTNFVAGVSGTYRADWSFWTELDPGQQIDMYLKKNGMLFQETLSVAKRSAEGSGTDMWTMARSVIIHMDQGEYTYLQTETENEAYLRDITLCVTLLKADA